MRHEDKGEGIKVGGEKRSKVGVSAEEGEHKNAWMETGRREGNERRRRKKIVQGKSERGRKYKTHSPHSTKKIKMGSSFPIPYV